MKNLVQTFVLVLLLLFAYLAYRRILERRASRQAPKEGTESAADEAATMNQSFLEKSAGRKAVDLVRVYSPFDLSFIRSMLYSSEIENYVQFEHMGGLFPGVGIEGFADSIIAVFEEDYAEARELTREFIEEKKVQRAEGDRLGPKIRNVGEFVVTGRFVSRNSDTRDPEFLDDDAGL